MRSKHENGSPSLRFPKAAASQVFGQSQLILCDKLVDFRLKRLVVVKRSEDATITSTELTENTRRGKQRLCFFLMATMKV